MKKVILVTGGSSGIGKSICEILHQNGHIVYGTSRNADNSRNYIFNLITLDVESVESVNICINKILEIEGRIDILINNAGVGIMGAIEDCSDNEILKTFNINVFGLVRTSRAVLPIMRNQNRGLIINIASIAGHLGLPYRGFYSATKASVHRITEAMRIELEPYNVKACIVDPGDFKTNIGGNRIVVKKVQEQSVYASETQRIENLINSEINKSLNSDLVGELILKIINTNKPKAYYRVGKFTQRLSVKIRALIGAQLFEKILKNHFKIKSYS